MSAHDILLVGVGGQGTLLAADVVALAGLAAGLEVKKSEVHGMAQRGGSVTSHVRWGERVASPLIAPGQADYLVAFERLEAMRYAHWLRPGGVAVINDYCLTPVSVTLGTAPYPDEAAQAAALAHAGHRLVVDANALAAQAGNVRANNIVLVGVLAALVGLEPELWRGVIRERVPARTVALNEAAFELGWSWARST